MKRLSYFTLVEVLIVLAILSIVTVAIGININKALEEQRFRTEVETIVNELRIAQDLMLILQADVTVKFLQGNDGITFTLETESQATRNWMNEILRVKPVFKTIRGISFKDELDLPVTEGAISLHFLSKGTIMSRGILRLSNSSDAVNVPSWAQVRVINLYGYPHPIASSAPSSHDPIFLPNEDKAIETTITSLTRQEIAQFKEQKEEEGSTDEEPSN
ncbi:type II secretion system protein [Parachlamydia sp. AcF125]|uniref:pilus assembly FimT family protein n=1 Tax=Parachlamydia sp. AcF125 TaxID=2795736 RepID=UPI001BC8D17F|nr:type II secretion system protein [Parachlamydia sp. AcF125]